ncbi:S8 family serine peptidase [Solwaraspora sp. WMMD1047]|uniref:S8 family serine peptidase n=1 Tax=Solwaraspora sp. WMMD1047 TaxID=3016102 RepID=UPI002415D301|nr:S8 family serine peptidase [Solwaraspora sp. WMMD1047]MDG4833695.1 S8 family serine peptidase [Solwaraspora sp. WMMD1047]
MVAAALVGVWAVVLTVGTQTVGWAVAQLLLVAGLDLPGWLWPATALGNALLVGLPAALLATVPRSPAVRTAGRAWLLAAAVLAGFGVLRAIALPHHELYLATLAALATVGALLCRLARRARPVGPAIPAAGIDAATAGTGDPAADRADVPAPPRRSRWGAADAATWFAVAAGLVMLLPWVWLGALGGVLETVLAGAAAAAVGWFAAALLDAAHWRPYEQLAVRRHGPGLHGRGAASVLVGGLVAGVALALVAAGVGQAGAQLAAVLVLPGLGFALAALRATATTGTASVGWLVGLTVLGPLAFVDPEELTLLLATGRDLPFWAAVAALVGLAGALLLALGFGFGFARPRAAVPRRAVAVGCVAVLLVATGGVYLGLGQPGWYGERLFVVLREQADLTAIAVGEPGRAGRDARIREVHRRLLETAERSQADLRRELDRFGLDYTPYYLVNGIEVAGGPVLRAWLSRRADVDRVLLSQRVRPLPAEAATGSGNDPAPVGPPWNITMIGADRVRSELGVDGAGVVVGTSDSGVDGDHPALAAGFRGGDDSWYDPWNDTRTPTDRGGHGTHTLGSAVGEGVGVAPGARWIGCVNLDRNLGNPARYLDCLQFMFAPFPTGGDPFTDGRPERAPDVLTNSWGCPPLEGCDASALQPATRAFAAAGVFFVAAAGNTGPFCGSIDDPPAPYPDVLSVGAVDRERRVTLFSSRGPAAGGVAKPDVVAPGAEVLSAMPGGGYAALDGTSMAAPHVAGVVALMWSANPALVGDLDRTRALLRETATPVAGVESSGDDGCGPATNVEGAGLVNGYAATRAAMAAG